MKYFIYILIILGESFINCQNKPLVLFFSRAGENYNVGTVEVGNTERFVNAMKSSLPSSTVYQKIEHVTQYPVSYSETLTIVRNEQDSNLRPDILIQ